MEARLVQYIVVRGDLISVLKWPIGAVIAQACHACTAVNATHHNDTDTQNYFKDMDNMHKIVLEISTESLLNDLANKLLNDNIQHKLWIEQPENISTCLALKPYKKEDVQKYFKKLKLFKGGV